MADAKTNQAGAAEQTLAWIAEGRDRLVALPEGRRSWLLGSVLLLAGAVAGLAWYVNLADWKVLFSGLEARDVQTVSQELEAAGITFRMTSDSSGIEVPAETLDKARMEVASKGMPQTGRLGFELFDKPNWVGSEFDEKVNYQRALEGELEHTIATLSAVRSARVHLVLPTDSVFSQEQKVAKASVVLKLKEANISREQVDAIRRMIAGSVEKLRPENVTLVDADGRVDLNSSSQRAGVMAAEESMQGKLVALLEPLVGTGNVRVAVTANYDQGNQQRTDEVNAAGTVGREKTAQSSGTPSGKAAMPPLLTGITPQFPAIAPNRDTQESEAMLEQVGGPGDTKAFVQREDAPGRLRRMSVAVLVNDLRIVEGSGASARVTWQARSRDDMHRLEELVQAAAGFDPARGDLMTVENVSFSSNTEKTLTEPTGKLTERAQMLLRSQPGMIRVAVGAGLGILIIVLVFRPVAKQAVAALRQVAALPTDTMPVRTREVHSVAGRDLPVAGVQLRREVGVDAVLAAIRRTPAQSQRVLESWIDAPQESS